LERERLSAENSLLHLVQDEKTVSKECLNSAKEWEKVRIEASNAEDKLARAKEGFASAEELLAKKGH